jgi:cell division protein FtsW
MMSATSPLGLRARERMPFAWDFTCLALVASLMLIGLVMVTSASMSIAARDLGNPFYFLERQFVFGFAGLLFAWLVTRIPTEVWDRYGLALLCVGLLLLFLVLIPGVGATVNGARRWLRVGPVNFQVSELAKVLVLTWVCSYCVRKRTELETTLPGLAKPVGLLTVAAFLLLCEPDFGATTVLFATGFAVLFVAGARLRYVLLLVSAAALSFAVLALTSAYRVKRLTGFLHPWDDPFNGGFQLTQSLIAIGRGAWFGVGLGSSVQKLFYLPEAHTDFVFAVLAEELGLVGVLAVIALFMALVWRAFQISRMAAHAGMRFQSYLALAFGVWLGLQAMVNIGVNMGVLPTKGLTLPLLSYGRSSLFVSLAWLGVVLRIYHEVKCSSRSAVMRMPGGVR